MPTQRELIVGVDTDYDLALRNLRRRVGLLEVGQGDSVQSCHCIFVLMGAELHLLLLLLLRGILGRVHMHRLLHIWNGDFEGGFAGLAEVGRARRWLPLHLVDHEDDVLVDFLVHGQLSGLAERAIAAWIVALERFLLSVDIHVLLQVLGERESFEA